MLKKDVIPHLKSIKDCPLFSQPNNSIVENMIQEDPEKRSHLSEILKRIDDALMISQLHNINN